MPVQTTAASLGYAQIPAHRSGRLIDSPTVTSLLRHCVSIILLGSALFQAVSLFDSSLSVAEFLLPVLLIEYEVWIGLRILSGSYNQRTHWIAVSGAGMFALGYILQLFLATDRASIATDASKGAAAIACVVASAAFVLLRPVLIEGERQCRLSRIRRFVVGALAMSALAFGVSFLGFDSPRAGFDFLCGERVIVSPRHTDLGSVQAGESRRIVVRVANFSSESRTIVGASTSCTCVNITQPPIVVAAGETREIQLRATIHGSEVFDEHLILYVAGASLEQQLVGVHADIVPQ